MSSDPRSPSPTAVFDEAVAAHRQGRLAQAAEGYRRVLQGDDGHADAWHLLGLVHLHQGQPAEAERLIRQALARGERPAFWANLGNLLNDSGRAEQAEAAYRRALELDTGLEDVCYNLGVLLQADGRLAEAQALYRRAVQIKPAFAAAHHNLGVVLAAGGRTAEAEAAYRTAIGLEPDFPVAHHSLGVLLHEARRLPQAQAELARAVMLKDDYVEAHDALGLVLQEMGRLDEAQACHERALELKPGYFLAHYNLGVLHDTRGQLAQAEARYRRALDIDPGFANAGFNLAIVLLKASRWREAWPLYEARHAPRMKPAIVLVPQLAFPRWQGEPLEGKSLVIWPEQGFGDYIQFARYAPLLKAQGVSRLTLVCYEPMAALLATVEGVDAVVTDLTQLARHDYWCLLMSLPLHFGTTAQTIPVAPLPYVHAPPERVAAWRGRLPAIRPRVGLVWRGSTQHKNDANRSLPGLRSLAPLWAVPGVSFVSLQKGAGEDEAAGAPQEQPLAALGAQMNDFADAAALAGQLDLVICVDTAIAHLAGAMGVPCWVLLPATGTDWRWALQETASPWYPSLRLFRQPKAPGWDATIAEVADALRAWALDFTPR